MSSYSRRGSQKPPRPVRRFLRAAHRRLAGAATGALLAALAAALVWFWHDEPAPGSAAHPFTWLWLMERRVQVGFVAALVVGAVPLTLLAWSARGLHRVALVIGWLALGGALVWWFGHRILVMLEAAWAHG